jgi:hypothetical protein
MIAHGQKPVIVEEPDDESCRKCAESFRWGRPDRRTHGDKIVLDELSAVPVAIQVLAQFQAIVFAAE